MAAVVDASVIVPLVALAGATERYESALRGRGALHVVDHTPLEVASALRRLELGGAISTQLAEQALARLARMPATAARAGQLLERAWQLRHNLTPYDAAYVALAEALDAPLITADERLARGAQAAGSPADVVVV